jgi:hypothetical protein
MRELQFEAWKPVESEGEQVDVMDKGPFRSLTDDSGNEFRRGERLGVSAATATQLRKGSLADSFVIFEPRTSRVDVSCG